jgi:hypothetical protein
MSLLKQWQDLAYIERSQKEYDIFWEKYLKQEQLIYENILENENWVIKGVLSQLAEDFSMDSLTFIGFLDGINTSLTNELDLDSLDESSDITLNIDMEKLYYNMLNAKADWLYNLPQWDNLLTLEKRKEIKKAYNKTRIVVKEKKIGRNEPCPCGSGKKYKQCCLNK